MPVVHAISRSDTKTSSGWPSKVRSRYAALVVALAIGLWFGMIDPAAADDADPEAIERGRYLASAAGCVTWTAPADACHCVVGCGYRPRPAR